MASSGSDQDAHALDERLLTFIDNVQLVGMRYCRWSGELETEPTSVTAAPELSITSSSRRTDDGFDCRFDAEVTLTDAGGESVGGIKVGVIASFSAKSAAANYDLVPAFVGKVAYFTMMPFVREALHSMSVRLGVGPVLLGLVRDIPAEERRTTNQRSAETPSRKAPTARRVAARAPATGGATKRRRPAKEE